MPKALVDNFTKEQLQQMVSESWSMRELTRKIGYKSNGSNGKTVQKRLDEYNISTKHFTGRAKNTVARSEENIFIENSTCNQSTLRRWYTNGNYSEYKCAICGQEPIWNNMPLTLTLDHINGNNHDDRLENLRWICPNCDRQLPTLEKISHSKVKPDKDVLYDQLIELKGNFTELGKFYGVSDNSVRKWCKTYSLPFHSKDYKPQNENKIHNVIVTEPKPVKAILSDGTEIKFDTTYSAAKWLQDNNYTKSDNIKSIAVNIGRVAKGQDHRKSYLKIKWEYITCGDVGTGETRQT